MARLAAHTFALRILTLLGNALTGVLIARALSADGRGELTAILVPALVAVWLFANGAQQAASFYVARRPEDAGRLMSTWLLALVPLALVGIVTFELLVPVLLAAQTEETQMLARLFLLSIVFGLVSQLGSGVLLGDHDFAFVNYWGLAQAVGLGVGYLTCVLLGVFTVRTAVAVTAAVDFVLAVVVMQRALRRHPLARPDLALGKSSLWYGFRVHGESVAGIVNSRFDLLLLPAFLGAASVGLYAVATSVANIVIAVATSLGPLVLPAAVRREGVAATRLVFASMHLSLAVALVLAGGLFVTAELALTLVYGNDFEPAAAPLRLLLIGTVALAGARVLSAGLGALDRPGLVALVQLPALLITIPGLILVVPRYGIDGAAVVSTAAYVSILVTAALLYRRAAGVRWSDFVPDRELLADYVRRLRVLTRTTAVGGG